MMKRACASDAFVEELQNCVKKMSIVDKEDAVEKDAVSKDAVEKDAVEKDAVEKDAVEKDAPKKDMDGHLIKTAKLLQFIYDNPTASVEEIEDTCADIGIRCPLPSTYETTPLFFMQKTCPIFVGPQGGIYYINNKGVLTNIRKPFKYVYASSGDTKKIILALKSQHMN